MIMRKGAIYEDENPTYAGIVCSMTKTSLADYIAHKAPDLKNARLILAVKG